jgi:allophanate hydrolase subunit 1
MTGGLDMTSSLAIQIQEQIRNYLASESDLAAFEDWIISHTWNVHQLGDRQIEELASAVQGLLLEYSSDEISLDQLRQDLADLVAQEPAKTADDSPVVVLHQ